jgi:DNA-binding beta-propeller fold protein YncE
MLRKLYSCLLIVIALSVMVPASAQTVIAQLPIPGIVAGIAVNPLKNEIYVTSASSSEESNGIISLVDGKTRIVTKTLPLNFDNAGPVLVNPVTQKVYVQACNFLFVANITCDLLVFDGRLNLLADLPSTGVPVAIDPKTDRIYILNENGLDVMSGETNQIIGEINLPGTSSVSLDLFRERLFAIVNNTELAVVDLHSNRIRDRVAIEPGSDQIGVNPITQRAYITHPNFVTTDPTLLTVLDLNSFRVVAHVPVTAVPRNVSVDFRANIIFVGDDNSLLAIDGEKNRVLTTIERATSAAPDLASGLVYATTNLVFFDDSGNSLGQVDVIKEPRRENAGKGREGKHGDN